MNKKDIAILAAKTLNLLMDLHCHDDNDEWTTSQTNQFHEIASLLPEDIQDDFWNNATMTPRHFGVKGVRIGEVL